MNLDDRIEIQKGLKEGKSFAEIGSMIARDGSTVSKEVRSHLIIKETGTRSRSYNPCVHRKNCRHEGDLCGELCIRAYTWNSSKYCKTYFSPARKSLELIFSIERLNIGSIAIRGSCLQK